MPAPNRPHGPVHPKPYDIVTFPSAPLKKQKPIGHHKYFGDRLHGVLTLKLTVGTGIHVSTGAIMMGSDVGENRIPLIKTMQVSGQTPAIPGSSLKGVVRSIYEAITNSTLGVVTGRYKSKIPPERLPCKKKDQLCPASQVFGALDWQGLISLRDAKCISSKFSVGFMPSLYSPRPERYFAVAARKFYYHAAKAVSGGDKGIPVQQISQKQVFETRLQFKNLTEAEFGTLLIALGQDPKYPFALKVGAGKPIGLGTLEVKVTQLTIPSSLQNRYSHYEDQSKILTDKELTNFINAAIATSHKNKLVQVQQLQQLQAILEYPTTRSAPDGMY
jgi:hypothetical protein